MPSITGIALVDVAILAFVAGFAWALGARVCTRLMT